MGLSTSKTSTKPAYEQQMLGAYDTVKSAYTGNQGNVDQTAGTLRELGSSLLDRFNAGDPGLKAATGYNTDVLGGKYLGQGNPQLQAMIDQTNGDVANGVNAHLGTRGLTGGSAQQQILARELARNETGLRFNDYNAERDRMGASASLAPGLSAAQYAPLAPGMAALSEGTSMPTDAANKYAAGVGGLLGQYTNTTKQDSIMDMWMKAMAAAGSAAKAAG